MPEQTVITRRPLVLVSAAFVLAVGVMTRVMQGRNGGAFVYPMDDAYIHLSMAHNLAFHGTWGVVPGHFESASSAPLWTAVLAAVLFVTRGAGEIAMPLVISVIFALWSLVSVDRLLASAPPLRRMATLVCVSVVLIPVTSIGMEHTLHLALVLASLPLFIRYVNKTATTRDQIHLAALIALATLCRLETVFLVFAFMGTATWIGPKIKNRTTNRWLVQRGKDCAVLVAPALGAIAALAVWNRAMGQGWLPNSVLSKSAIAGSFPIISTLHNPMGWRHLLSVVVLVATGLAVLGSTRPARPRTPAAITASITVFATVPQAIATVWTDQNIYFFRYHAYLFVFAMLAVGCLEGRSVQRRGSPVNGAIPVMLVVCIVAFSIPQISRLPFDSWETGHQQMQTARFFAAHADGAAVAINDLGAVAYLHRGPIVDLVGLGSWQVIRQMHDNHLSPRAIQQITRANNVQIAALFPTWFRDGLPPGWTPLENWCLEVAHTDLVGNRCVTFYATVPGTAAHWRQLLRSQHRELPSGVVVEPVRGTRANRPS